MYYRRTGMPEEDEIVLCTVKQVHSHSVFIVLDEYEKTGIINISEVSPGRIRNIRDYVQEGKKVVCKVLRVDKVKGHIDLSLRRVNEGQRRKKQDEIKTELKAEKIIEYLAKKIKKDVRVLYEEISEKVFQKYDYISECFDDIVSDNITFEKLGFSGKLAKDLTETVKEKIKPSQVTKKGDLIIISHLPEGVEDVKKALLKAQEAGATVTYKGAGKYNVSVTAPDYKEAERILEKSTLAAIKAIEKSGGIGSFKVKEKKDKD